MKLLLAVLSVVGVLGLAAPAGASESSNLIKLDRALLTLAKAVVHDGSNLTGPLKQYQKAVDSMPTCKAHTPYCSAITDSIQTSFDGDLWMFAISMGTKQQYLEQDITKFGKQAVATNKALKRAYAQVHHG